MAIDVEALPTSNAPETKHQNHMLTEMSLEAYIICASGTVTESAASLKT